jgi:two-component system response regulator PilR (NtrC family)
MLKTDQYDLCLTDMQLPDGRRSRTGGMDAAIFPQRPVAVITAHGNMETAVRALKLGAFDFVSKPLDLAGLRKLVSTAIKMSGNRTARPASSARDCSEDSSAMQHLREMIAGRAQPGARAHLRRIRHRQGTGRQTHP